MLTDEEVEAFVDDGFVAVRGALSPELVEGCRGPIDAELRRCGVDVDDPTTWNEPVVRFGCPLDPELGRASGAPLLEAAYDQLLGAGRWIRRQVMIGGVVARFPHGDEPWDHGWHVDGGFEIDGEWRLDVRSRQRGLLAFFLLSDVGEADAPTELKVGSHLDVPAMLEPYGEQGVAHPTLAHNLSIDTLERRSVLATGASGDVILCHPFLVHRATWPNALSAPRVIAQVLVELEATFALEPPATCPVEAAIMRGLEAAHGDAATHSDASAHTS